MWNKTTYPFLVQALCIIPLKSIRMWASFRIFAKMRESRPCVSFVLFCKIPLNRRPGAYEDPIECNLFDFNRNDDDFLP